MTDDRRKLRVLDLFSGIGGFSLGLERTGGFETVAFCEIEPHARAILARHWPGVPCYDDVAQLTAERLRADGIGVDVITAGFPCQDISYAGEGAGLAGERSGLWSHVARLAGELRPGYVILENVSALLDRGLGEVLGDLAAIRYDAEWHCIPASYVGAPHERDRFWLVANPAEVNVGAPDHIRGPGIGERIEAWFRAAGSPTFCEHEGRATIAIDGEPALCLAADGLSYGLVQRQLERLGNTVVPQIPELIGRAILQGLAA